MSFVGGEMSMQIQSSLYSGFNAYSSAVSNANKSASNIADLANETSEVNLESEVVNLEMAELQAKSGAKILDTYNKTVGSLIDIEV